MKTTPEPCEPCQPQGMSAFGFRIGISLALAGQGMVFGLGYNNALNAGEAPPHGSLLYWVLHGALILSALGVVLILGGPLMRESVKALLERRISVEALFVLSAAGAFAGSLISSFRGSGSVYYEVVSIVLCVYAIGKQIGVVQKGRIGEAVASFREAFDRAAVVREDGSVETVGIQSIEPTDRVRIRPGDPIPVDGVILKGSGYLRETALTGEPAPVSKGPGDGVMAGTWSVDGNFLLRPETTGHRTIDRILRLLESAPQRPSRLQETADRLMAFFVPFVSIVSLGTFLGWMSVPGVPWMEALFNAMAVLLVACPCALGLAMPTGIWAGLYYLSQRGIVGRHGSLLDSLADCTVIVFDKTGTLSQFQLDANLRAAGKKVPDLAAAVASLGKASHHPVSQALTRLGDARYPVADLHIHPGEGISGSIDGHRLLAGEPSLLQGKGVPLPGDLPTGTGKPVLLAWDGQYAGTVFLAEVLRDQAESSMEALQKLGIHCRILSGDPASVRKFVGGVKVEGGLSPEAKAAQIQGLVETGEHVLFIGDGVNDLPAMEASHASLAIDLGAALATEYADGLLVDGRVGTLPGAIRHARRLKKSLRGNLLFAMSYNVVGMGLAAAGLLHPVVAALLMVGSSVVVSFRALRAAGISA